MPSTDTFESIQATLQPLEELQGEQTQLESWVNDSFSALEKLHEELTEWQTELARKQTELDLREDALDRCQEAGGDLGERAVQWKKELDEAREEIRQLEEESNEQLQELESLENSYHKLESEFSTLKKQNEDAAAEFAAAKSQTDLEKEQLADEFQELRRLVEKQSVLLAEKLGEEENGIKAVGDVDIEPETDTSSRSAKLRQRAQSRRAAKRRRKQNTEESDQA